MTDWLPSHLRQDLPDKLSYTPSDAGRRAFQRKARPVASDWLVKNLSAVEGSSKSTGVIDPHRYPHTWGIADAADFPSVRETYLTKVAQSAGSWISEGMLLYWAIWDCVTCGLYYPEQDDTERRFKNNIKPQLKSRKLVKYTTGLDEDLTLKNIRLANSSLIVPGWLSSTSKLKSTSMQRALVDECASVDDGYNDKNEANVWDMLDKRFNDCRDSYKIIFPSTPNTFDGKITQLFIKAEAVFDFMPLCPDCGMYQHMVHEHVVFEPDTFLTLSQSEKQEAVVYVCKCGSIWDDLKRWGAIKKGGWFARLPGWVKYDDDGKACDIHDPAQVKYEHDDRTLMQYLEEVRPATVGFHVDDLIIGPKPLWGYVQAFMEALHSQAKMQNWYNQHRARPYVRKQKARPIHELINRADERPAGVLPGGNQVAVLLNSVDVQDHKVYYGVYAFGWGYDRHHKPIVSDCPKIWLVDYGEIPLTRAGVINGKKRTIQVPLEEAIKDLEDRAYVTTDDIQWRASATVIDSRGHRTGEAYDLCNYDPAFRWAYVGMEIKSDGKETENFGPGYRIPYRRKTDHRGVGGLMCHQLHEFDQHTLQWLVDTAISIDIEEHGAFVPHSEVCRTYARHFGGVQYDKKTRKWTKPAKHDYRDTFMMAIGAALHIYRVMLRQRVLILDGVTGAHEKEIPVPL